MNTRPSRYHERVHRALFWNFASQYSEAGCVLDQTSLKRNDSDILVWVRTFFVSCAQNLGRAGDVNNLDTVKRQYQNQSWWQFLSLV